MKKAVLTVLAVFAIGIFSNKVFAQTTTTSTTTTASADLLATLSSNPDYVPMAMLIRAANLTDTLKKAGPYTVFAPTATAFSNMSAAKLDELMKNPAALTALVRNHIVMGKLDKATILKSLTPTDTVKTLDGKPLVLGVADKHLVITDSEGNTAKVVAFDIMGSNGVAVGLDAVLTKKE